MCLWVDWTVLLLMSTGLTPVTAFGWQQVQTARAQLRQLGWLDLFPESFTLGFFRLWQSGHCPNRGKAGTIGPLKAHTPGLVQHDFICILLVRATPKPSSDAE